MSNTNMLLLPIILFIQKLCGLHSIIIMKTLLKQFYYTEKYVRSNLMRYGTHRRKKIICRLAIRGIKHFFGSYNQHWSAKTMHQATHARWISGYTACGFLRIPSNGLFNLFPVLLH